MLKDKVPLLEGEVLDSSTLDVSKLRAYFEKEMEDCKKQGAEDLQILQRDVATS